MGEATEGIPGWAARIEAEPALSAELELELARQARAGDGRARERLVAAHLRYALRYAKKLSRYGVSVAELTNEGVLGLLEAAERYDPERGVRFSTYAASWIRALALERLVRQMSPIGHAGGAYRTKYWFALRRERAKLMQLGLRGDELVRAVAERLGIGADTTRDLLLDLDARAGSVEAAAEEGGHELASNEVSPERMTSERERADLVQRRLAPLLARCDARERALILRRMMSDEPDSLAVLGREHGVSRERMRQLESRALKKLRRRFTNFEHLL